MTLGMNLPAVSPEGTNLLRLIYVIKNPCTACLRHVLNTHIPNGCTDIKHAVSSNRHKLKPPVLTKKQYSKLFPQGQLCPKFDVSICDMTLLYTLLRNISSMQQPSTGWGNPVSSQPRDTSIGANVERLRVLRNDIIHEDRHEISDSEFIDFWDNIETCLKDIDNILGNTTFKQDLMNLKTCNLDPPFIQKEYGKLLQKIKENQKKHTDKCEEIKDTTRKTYDKVSRLEENQKKHTDNCEEIKDTTRKTYDKVSRLEESQNKVMATLDVVNETLMKTFYKDSRMEEEQHKHDVNVDEQNNIMKQTEDQYHGCIDGAHCSASSTRLIDPQAIEECKASQKPSIDDLEITHRSNQHDSDEREGQDAHNANNEDIENLHQNVVAYKVTPRESINIATISENDICIEDGVVRLTKQFVYIKSNLEKKDAVQIARDLLKEKHITNDEFEAIEGSIRSSCVDTLLKTIILGDSNQLKSFLTALNVVNQNLFKVTSAEHVTAEDISRFKKAKERALFVPKSTCRASADNVLNKSDVRFFQYHLSYSKAVVDSLNDTLLAHFIVNIREHSNILKCNDLDSKIQTLCETMNLCNINVKIELKVLLKASLYEKWMDFRKQIEDEARPKYLQWLNSPVSRVRCMFTNFHFKKADNGSIILTFATGDEFDIASLTREFVRENVTDLLWKGYLETQINILNPVLVTVYILSSSEGGTDEIQFHLDFNLEGNTMSGEEHEENIAKHEKVLLLEQLDLLELTEWITNQPDIDKTTKQRLEDKIVSRDMSKDEELNILLDSIYNIQDGRELIKRFCKDNDPDVYSNTFVKLENDCIQDKKSLEKITLKFKNGGGLQKLFSLRIDINTKEKEIPVDLPRETPYKVSSKRLLVPKSLYPGVELAYIKDPLKRRPEGISLKTTGLITDDESLIKIPVPEYSESVQVLEYKKDPIYAFGAEENPLKETVFESEFLNERSGYDPMEQRDIPMDSPGSIPDKNTSDITVPEDSDKPMDSPGAIPDEKSLTNIPVTEASVFESELVSERSGYDPMEQRVWKEDGITCIIQVGKLKDIWSDVMIIFGKDRNFLPKTIIEKVGPQIQREFKDKYPSGLKDNEVAVLSGFNLPVWKIFYCNCSWNEILRCAKKSFQLKMTSILVLVQEECFAEESVYRLLRPWWTFDTISHTISTIYFHVDQDNLDRKRIKKIIENTAKHVLPKDVYTPSFGLTADPKVFTLGHKPEHSTITLTIQVGKLEEIMSEAIVIFEVGKGQWPLHILSSDILEKAGPMIQEEFQNKYPAGLEYGEVAVLSGHNLPFKHIIYGVLPRWPVTWLEQVIVVFLSKCFQHVSNKGITSIAYWIPRVTYHVAELYISVIRCCMEMQVYDELFSSIPTENKFITDNSTIGQFLVTEMEKQWSNRIEFRLGQIILVIKDVSLAARLIGIQNKIRTNAKESKEQGLPKSNALLIISKMKNIANILEEINPSLKSEFKTKNKSALGNMSVTILDGYHQPFDKIICGIWKETFKIESTTFILECLQMAENNKMKCVSLLFDTDYCRGRIYKSITRDIIIGLRIFALETPSSIITRLHCESTFIAQEMSDVTSVKVFKEKHLTVVLNATYSYDDLMDLMIYARGQEQLFNKTRNSLYVIFDEPDARWTRNEMFRRIKESLYHKVSKFEDVVILTRYSSDTIGIIFGEAKSDRQAMKKFFYTCMEKADASRIPTVTFYIPDLDSYKDNRLFASILSTSVKSFAHKMPSSNIKRIVIRHEEYSIRYPAQFFEDEWRKANEDTQYHPSEDIEKKMTVLKKNWGSSTEDTQYHPSEDIKKKMTAFKKDWGSSTKGKHDLPSEDINEEITVIDSKLQEKS